MIEKYNSLLKTDKKRSRSVTYNPNENDKLESPTKKYFYFN